MLTSFSRSISTILPTSIVGFFFSSIQCSLSLSTHVSNHSDTFSPDIQSSKNHSIVPSRPTYLSLLKASSSLPSYHLAISTHAHVLKSGFLSDTFVATALVDALSKCFDVDGARALFDGMPEKDIAAWNAMLSGYARNGYSYRAFSLFYEMGCGGMVHNSLTLSVLLQACGELCDKARARCIHAYAYRCLELADTFLLFSLVVCYNRCGDVYSSENIFERLADRDIVLWNAMMAGYAKNGLAWRTLEALQLLGEDGLRSDVVTLETVLQACAQIGNEAIVDGQLIHGLLVRMGCTMDVYVANSLLLMYCKCGRMNLGQSLFNEMDGRNLVSWNILVNGYAQNKCPEKILALVRDMRKVEVCMSSDLFVYTFQAIKQIGLYLEDVMSIHCLVIVMGFDSDVFVSSSLISSYGYCGEVELARRSLECVASEQGGTAVSWNAMLSVYMHQGWFHEAIELLHLMQLKACKVDAATLVITLSMSTQHLDLESGRACHAYIIRNGFESDIVIATSLLDFYAQCERLDVACWLFSKMPFRNLVSWNTMIHGCSRNGFPRISLCLFHLMKQRDGLIPDATSLVGVIEAIAQRGNRNERNYIHKYAIQAGFTHNEYVVNSLISMHSRFMELDMANLIFNTGRKSNSSTWNTMIAEYSHHGLLERAISVFHLMKLNNVLPDSVTLLCLLRTCSSLGSLNCVMWAHNITGKAGYESDIHIGTSLVDGYTKCGDLSMARLVFDRMNSKTTISWNSMIRGYGMHGNADEASNLFSQMQQSGIFPSIVTFLLLISACSHTGDVEKGRHYFEQMTRTYSLPPRTEHLSSFFDLLGRKGLVKEAFESITKLPVNPGVCSWGALVGACRLEGNFEVGLAAAEKLFELDPVRCGYHVLLSNMYMESGRGDDANRIRRKIGNMQLQKVPGWSTVESTL